MKIIPIIVFVLPAILCGCSIRTIKDAKIEDYSVDSQSIYLKVLFETRRWTAYKYSLSHNGPSSQLLKSQVMYFKVGKDNLGVAIKTEKSNFDTAALDCRNIYTEDPNFIIDGYSISQEKGFSHGRAVVSRDNKVYEIKQFWMIRPKYCQNHQVYYSMQVEYLHLFQFREYYLNEQCEKYYEINMKIFNNFDIDH